MVELVEFLAELSENNNREWFAAHKEQYKAIEKRLKEFAAKLIGGVAAFDPSVADLTVADCTYRIYRDIRFSHDKSPYKTWSGVFIAPHGKKAGYAGYYIHFEPSGCFLYAGSHCPTPEALRSIREEIIDNGDNMVKAVEESNGFTLIRSQSLKRNPKEFPPGHKYDELLRLKEFGIEKPINPELLAAGDEVLLHSVVEDLRSTYPLVEILNRAIHYAYEEMM
ncbi:MAG: DUF2461 domain-containing protein [Alistipes sp.]|nr:DUF2461 domain-containing protein [Alistipes sp.]